MSSDEASELEGASAPWAPKGALGVHHLAICVRDLARAESFYVDVLGLELLRRWEDAEGEPRSIWLALGGGAFLAVERVEGAGARRDDRPGHHCLALRIERSAREAWSSRLALAGHPVERESECTLYLRDPEGALLALSHHPERA
ncbi:MAG: VOC family protein [Myxococcales bacterium]|nr:VOC family protein [Myxococcales bacterium]